jgi:alkylation response protein AidB-like acyl-CoA dehydrogenase
MDRRKAECAFRLQCMRWAEQQVQMNIHADAYDFRMDEHGAAWEAIVYRDDWAAIGVHALTVTNAIWVNNGKIASFTSVAKNRMDVDQLGNLWRPGARAFFDGLASPAVCFPAIRFSWQDQRRWAFQTAFKGAWWGTIVSEPGTGGDTRKTKATARPDRTDGWRISGQKHFGSGAGIMSYLITSALPAGEEDVETFHLDARDLAWDGSTGMKLAAAWNGCGMIATQSHAFVFEDFPAARLAWPADNRKLAGLTGPAGQEEFVRTCWAAITLGIVETALASARQQLARRQPSMRAFEQVEWSRAEVDGWLVEQAYAGMLRPIEEQRCTGHQTLSGKIAVAELAESALSRICRVLGGNTYTHDSPFAYWFEDVRALGFLRPPWAFAYEEQFNGCWPER